MSSVDEILSRASQAAAVFSQYNQADTDKIVEAVHRVALANRVRLAKMAVEETGIGNWQDKVVKNFVAAEIVYEDIKDLKTAGIIAEDKEKGIIEIAQPLGPIFGIIPCTNPTSTIIFKIISALKTRNPIIISPHPRGKDCCVETARLCYEAALKADAPDYCVQWLENPSNEQNQQIMRHPKLALILATGGSALVKEAYSSGKPALGVGSGNVPVFIEKSADLPFAVDQIIASKTFDNGTICASEQFLVVEKENVDQIFAIFKEKHVYVLNQEEIKAVESIAYNYERKLMDPSIVGKSVAYIAEKAGINVPKETKLLIAPLSGIGEQYPLSSEILAPVLSFHVAQNFEHALKLCIELNFYGGCGHTVSMFSNSREKINQFALEMNAGRIVINMPSSQGAVGGLFNKLHPSFTLGCGTSGNNITTDNITARNLLNIQRVTLRRGNERLANFKTELFFDEHISSEDLDKEYNRNFL